MFRKIFFFVVVILFSGFIQAQINNRLPGQIIVQLQYRSDVLDFQNQLTEHDIFIQNLSPISFRLNLWLLHFDETMYDEAEMLQKINSLHQVETVQFNHTLQKRNLPDDDDFSLQWNMLNTGSGGVDDADIDADEAWNITTGGRTWNGDSIVIAIIDDGFDLDHLDLKFQKNYFETPANGIDDDSNGYIDDFDGWSATTHDGVIEEASHGTHLSGIAAATGDNSLGVAGVNWHVKVLPVTCNIIESEVLEAYSYVFVQRELYNNTDGAKGFYIVSENSSFGIDLADPADYPIWCAMYDTLGKAGILSAAATTNGNYNVDVVGDIPTACASDYLISVTNTNKFDQLLSGGYGAITIDLGAPGTSIYSTTSGNSYGTLSGTSLSSPHVAGAVALLMSDACIDFLNAYKEDPSQILLIKQYILEGVDTLLDLTGITVSNGRLNLYKSLMKMNETYCANAVNDVENILDANVFPNPASTKIFIRIKDVMYQQKKLKVEIINMLGEKTKTENSITSAILETEGISVQDLPQGSYLLRLTDENNLQLFSSLLVIQ